MAITASALRNNIYRMLDEVAEGGRSLTIKRKGKTLKIIRESTSGKLSGLPRHHCIEGDPETIVHMDWSGGWHDDLP